MADNTIGILAIELLSAVQGIDFHKPLNSSPILEKARELLRKSVAFYEQDRFFAPDIAFAKSLNKNRQLAEFVPENLWLDE